MTNFAHDNANYTKMRYLTIIFTLISLAACDGVFHYHPYDVRFDGPYDINKRNMQKIEQQCLNKDTLVFAFVSDSHNWLSSTEDMVKDVNSRSEIDFVIHGGDLTDCGTTREFEWTRSILQKLRKPYVALIGNHDFLGTGEEVFLQMFGPLDFSFIAARIKFVCLNTNATEYNYLAAVPNFDFMEDQFHSDSLLFDRTIVCMHARPYSEQFNNNVAKSFELYMHFFPGLIFCLNGHDHCFQADEIYNDGVMYYGVDCLDHRNYYLITITPDNYEIEKIHY
ncbi:MAG: metallophosphoesterase [Prevotella sp.]|nr:metallophosphoesterase [Prevotella sp.]